MARSARPEAPAPGGSGACGSRRAGGHAPGPGAHPGGRARPRRLGRHRGARHLLPALLRQPGTRGRGGRAGAFRVPRPARLPLGRGLREHARVRALDHRDDERLHPADVRPLRGTARAGARGPRLRGTAVRDDVLRGLDRARDGATLSGAGAGIRPRRGSADVRPSRAQARSPRPAVVRHGRHHREGGAGAGLHRAQAVRPGGRTGTRVQARKRSSGEASGHRHDRDRLRRRLPRPGR